MSGYRNQKNGGGQYRRQSGGGGGSSSGYNQYQSQGGMSRQQMMNPWQSGMMPSMGSGMQSGRSDEAALAFNILNQVLSSDSSGGGGHQSRQSGHMNMGSRLQDRRQGQSQYSNQNRNDQRSRWDNRSRSPHNRDNRSNQSRRDGGNRGDVRNRLGRPQDRNRQFNNNQNRNYGSGGDRNRRNDRQNREDSRSKDSDKNKAQPSSQEMKNILQDLDPACLKCHVCEVYTFPSIESFKNHKKSSNHKQLVELYNKRNDAALQLMRADNKLTENRNMVKTRISSKDQNVTKCVKCECFIAEAYKVHKKTTEHELVENHMMKECCNMNFHQRKEYEEHRLTLSHLKRQSDADKEEKEKEKENETDEGKIIKAFSDEEEQFFNHLKAFKEEHALDIKTAEDMPEYDAGKPVGVNYIHKKRKYDCEVCKKSFPGNNLLAVAHCRSFNHYLMMMAHLQTNMEDIQDEEVFESEEEEEVKPEKSEEKEKETDPNEDENTSKSEDQKKSEEEDTENQEGNGEEKEEEEMDTMPPFEGEGILLEDADKAEGDDDGGEGNDDGGETNDGGDVVDEGESDNDGAEGEGDDGEGVDETALEAEEKDEDVEIADAEEEEQKTEEETQNEDRVPEEEVEAMETSEEVANNQEEPSKEEEKEEEEEEEEKPKTRRRRGRRAMHF